MSSKQSQLSQQPSQQQPQQTPKVENGMSAYLFVDTFAFEKLAAQSECRVGQRCAQMTGYEAYIIEQWACERRVNTVVASYTGNSKHIVEAQVLLVPSDLENWSQLTFKTFEELARMHILPKETPLGNMLVTSLSSLPSNLSLVSMSQYFRESYVNFVINENLRRLNVVGRIAVTAEEPSDSMIATFRRVFLIPSSINPSYAVQEVATLIQISLFYFGLLEPEVIDGLLCDHTLRAIDQWWSTFGGQRFKVSAPRPQDKLFMRVNCAALVGTVIGARQRLSALGLKPPKDPFDAENFVECVRKFQKLVKIPRTSLLDETTYFKLIHETANFGTSGNINVLTVMKSTVKEGLSGKATEAVDDWETLNLELLVNNVRGSRAKYLWLGKGDGKVPHLYPPLPLSQCGKRTNIPLISLASDDMDRYSTTNQHNNTQQADAQSPQHLQQQQQQHQHHHRHHHPHLHRTKEHHIDGGSGQAGGTDSRNTTDPATSSNLQEFSDHEGDATNSRSSFEPPSESYTSLVHRFRKRKPPLGEAFDEKHSQNQPTAIAPQSAYAHMRSQSTSSDRWFAWHTQQLNGQWPNTSENAPSSDSDPSDPLTTESPYHASHDETSKSQEGDSSYKISEVELLTRDDQSLDPKYVNNESFSLRRVASFSDVEQNIYAWEPFASAPRVLKMYDQAQALQMEVMQRVEADEKVDHEVNARLKKNESLLAEAQRDNVLIKYHVNASLRKNDAVHRRVKELEAFMARLDYEMATLSVKLKDVDQSVLAFAAKVVSADAKWLQLKNMQVKPWYQRWFNL